MSDGLTDGNRSSLAAERRRMLLRSVAASLAAGDDRMKLSDAVNDIMSHEASLYAVDGARDREAQAAGFIDRLRAGDRPTWARYLAFAMDNPNGYGDEDFAKLKDLSPFRDMTLAVARSDGSCLRLVRSADIECTIAKQAGPRGHKLYVLDLSVFEDYDL